MDRNPRPVRSIVAGLLVLAAASPGGAQTLLRDQGEHLAVRSTPAPGAPGKFFGTFESVLLDDAGGVLFSVDLCQTPGLSFCSNTALYYRSAHGGLELVAREEDPEPSGSLPGMTLRRLNDRPRLGANGAVLTSGRLEAGSGQLEHWNDGVLYLGRPEALAVLAREGRPAPGTLNASFGPGGWEFIDTDEWTLAGDGRAVFLSQLSGGDVAGTSNDVALFAGTPGQLALVARKGAPVATGPTLRTLMPWPILQANAAGMIAFDAEYLPGTGTPPATFSDDSVILLDVPGSGAHELIREGDQSPWLGFTYTGNWFTSERALDGAGRMIVRASLQQIPGDCVVVAVAGPDLPVALRGEPAPDVPGATFAQFHYQTLGLASDGRVVIGAKLSETSVDDDSGIWSGVPGALELVVREGDPAPGSGGRVFGDLWQAGRVLSDGGVIDFDAQLTDPLGGPIWNSRWRFEPGRGLRLVALADGGGLALGGGLVGKLLFSWFDDVGNGWGRAHGLRSDGLGALRVTCDWPLASVARVGGELLAVSPAVLSAATGGVAELSLHAGSERDGDTYLVLASASGPAPGIPIGDFLLPLVRDFAFEQSLSAPNQPPLGATLGSLDELGRATGTVTVPPGVPGLAGVQLDLAFVALDVAAGGVVTAVSNPARLLFAP